MAWARNDRSLIYVSSDASGSFLWQQSLDEATPRLLAGLGRDEIEDLALSPDGRTLAFTRGQWIHAAILIEGLK